MNFTEEQKQAINQEGNIIVSAGAGSGKTAVLSERVIRKLKEGIHVNELLILTFTDAAAKEMKERIRKKIIDNHLMEELNYLDIASITTFDSFAFSIVKKYYYLLNISPDLKIVTNLDCEKENILDDIFEEHYDNLKFQNFIGDFCVKDDQNIKEYILQIANKISLKVDYMDYLNTYIETFYNENKINNNIQNYIELIKNKIMKCNNILENIVMYDNNYYLDLSEILNPLLESKDYEQYKTNSQIELPSIPRGSVEELKLLKKELTNLIKEIQELTKYEIEELKKQIIETKKYAEVIIELLQEYFKKLQEYKEIINRYEFNDIAHMAIEVTLKNSKVQNELRNSFKEIMIDEYQDTNDLQEYFVSLISNNNVYMVGDIKQSIYRFRNANPNIFKHKYEVYSNSINGTKIDLNKNFRSRDFVLKGINQIFNPLMELKYGGADYKKSHQLIFGNISYKDKEYQQNYEMEIYKYEPNQKDSKEEQEIFLIANDILDKIQNHYQVLDNNQLRDAQYKDFAILIDRTTNFDLIKKIFEYKKIPLTVLKDESINNGEEINIFKNLITLVLKNNEKKYDEAFEYALVSILRSYLIRLSDDEIYNIINQKEYQNIEIMKKISSIKIFSINSVIDQLIDTFDIYNKITLVGNIESRINLINYIITLGQDLSSMGKDIYQFEEYLNNLIERNIDLRYQVNDNNYGVKLMTIYKSKGLEFPICYFPFLYKKFNISDLKELFIYDNSLGIICPYFKDGIKNTFYKTLLKEEYIKEEISEKIRLFYVALTRAKEKLIMIQEKDSNTLWIDKDKYRSFKDFINSLEQYLNTKEVNIEVDKNYIKTIKTENLNYLNSDIKVEEINVQKIDIEFSIYSAIPTKLISKEEYDNMQYGINLHKQLEDFNLDNPYVKRFLKHNEFKNITAKNIYHEYEFMHNGNIGIIDFMVEEDDKIIIVDFKTNNIDKEEYYIQVRNYMNYIRSVSNKQIYAYLYSIAQDILLEVH